ncbi:GNAT family N-acetyltransferase [Geomicrobium sediminis]|uniref:GNAT family N-acyltransferase n=1 Tax=Geomicrobium sediminis TaxID=1347788 RepID=A0ABS2P933_9BACL|nr:GNAT family N-acetyltransferase [Geomicrobium sediminis]MBM7631506.1 putative GNAT family N-acyltransferase [Geomicrobium sediminis]
MKAIIATTEEEMKQVQQIRYDVFVIEQEVSEEDEWDEFEDESVHFLLESDQQYVGAGRVRWLGTTGKAERICILEQHRGTGAGKAVMEALESYVAMNNGEKVKLNAQTQARGFYERIGYTVTSEEEFLDAGIPHVTMEKTIN